MQAHKSKICKQAGCEWFVENKTYPAGYCQLRFSPILCGHGDKTEAYKKHKEKQLLRY
jgi:hypothetical protein